MYLLDSYLSGNFRTCREPKWEEGIGICIGIAYYFVVFWCSLLQFSSQITHLFVCGILLIPGLSHATASSYSINSLGLGTWIHLKVTTIQQYISEK